MLYHYRTNKAYIRAQAAANKEKLDFVWVQSKNVEQIVLRLQHFGVRPRVGLCHGTRSGQEQKFFAEHLPCCELMGTEIASTAEAFPLTIHWDFHDPMWKGVCDFVYSNSLDHARDPEQALRTWLASLVSDGVLIIEWGSDHERSTRSDPFGATLEELLAMVEQCGGEVMAVEDAPVKPKKAVYLKLVYIRRTRLNEASRSTIEQESMLQIPSMGGRKIAQYLRQWAVQVRNGNDIVELGVWLGAGTVQLASGALGRPVMVWGFDGFQATSSQVRKARVQGVTIPHGRDTTDQVKFLLNRAGVKGSYTLVKGMIPPAAYEGRLIGLYVDDACKREGPFLKALRLFGPHWIPGVTVVVLMDFWYFERKPTVPGLEYQHRWMNRHRDCFDTLMERMPGISGAAFRYLGGSPWKNSRNDPIKTHKEKT